MASEEPVVAEEEYLGHPIRLEAQWQGADLAVRLCGGSRPHIGSVVFAVPRPSLQDPAETSSTASVLNRPGHQDEWPGRRIAEEFSSRLKTNVAVLCGIHYDGLSREQVEGVSRLCGSLARKVLPLLDAQARSRSKAGEIPEENPH